MIIPFLIDLNPLEIKYYPLIINLDKCSGICNSFDDLSTKICIPSKRKNVNVKVSNMIANENEVKTMLKHISCDCKFKFNSKTCNSNQIWNNETCQCESESSPTCKKRL